jgi:CRP-like cAMP-binding protein
MQELSRDEVVGVLLRHRAFSGLMPGDLRGLLEASALSSFAQGEVIYEHGEPGQEGFLLLSGRVELRTVTGPGQESASQIYTAGALFGQEGLIKAWPRAERCVAAEEVLALRLSGAAFRGLLEAGDPASFRITEQLLGFLVEAVREANRRFQDLHVRPDRTLRLLRGLVEAQRAH